jgi:integrase
MFKRAEEWGLWDGDNPATRIKWFPRTSRFRFVQPEEMPKLLEALAVEPLPVQAFFMICLLTGSRGAEARGMKWSHLNLTQGIWSVPTTKTGRPHIVPLAPALVGILKSMPQRGEWVFTSPQSAQRCIKRGICFLWWGRIRKRAGLNDLNIHDLRRTTASWLACRGQNLAVIARVLGHTSLANTAIYARLNLDPIKAALCQHADSVLAMGGQAIEPVSPELPASHGGPKPSPGHEEPMEWPG